MIKKLSKIRYSTLHNWVKSQKGLPQICSHCGKNRKEVTTMDWANIDHRYQENLNDYIPLCRSCHRKYDLRLFKKKARGKWILPKITKSPRLIKIRRELMQIAKGKHGLFIDEIGLIFRLGESRISQILKVDGKNKIKR